jgi:hypothetical protein
MHIAAGAHTFRRRPGAGGRIPAATSAGLTSLLRALDILTRGINASLDNPVTVRPPPRARARDTHMLHTHTRTRSRPAGA